MSHRQQQRPTHTLTAEGRVQSGTDDLGEPVYSRETVAENVRVRVDPSHELVRDEAGERVDEVIAVWGPFWLAGDIDESMSLSLSPLYDGESYEGLEPVSVTQTHSRHGGPSQTVIEIEGV